MNELNLELSNYRVETFPNRLTSEFDFLDIKDKRNGVIYCFWKSKDETKWTFHRQYQEFSSHSFKIKTNLNPDWSITETKEMKPIPQNPFEQHKEYEIKWDGWGELESIKVGD